MKSPIRLVVVLIALALAIPSTAQADRRDKRRKRPAAELSVTKWWPQSGPVGTTVNITGTGFSRRTQLLVGGNVVRPRRLSARRITFVVPNDYGDGAIVLRGESRGGYDDDDDGGQELDVGTYQVIVPDVPEIRRWSPRRGAPGTKVRIEGRHFDDASVFWGRRRLRAVDRGEDWFEVEVPRRARRNETFTVRSKYGSATTKEAFVLYQAAEIRRLDPWRATYGQTVVIHGRNLPSNAEVFWGDTELSIAKFDRRGRKLWVTVPDDLELGSQWLYVYDGETKVRSPKQLEIYEDRRDDGDDDDDY